MEGDCSDCRPITTPLVMGSFVDCTNTLSLGEYCLISADPGWDCQNVSVVCTEQGYIASNKCEYEDTLYFSKKDVNVRLNYQNYYIHT
eukprot:UN00723